MRKRAAYILLFLLASLFVVTTAGAVAIPGAGQLAGVSSSTAAGGDSLEKLNSAGLSVLHTAKVLISGLAVIYLVYAGIMMVISSSDEGSLGKSKKQLMYALIAFLFVNIPGKIYAVFSDKSMNVTEKATGTYANVQKSGTNIFVNFAQWNGTVEGGILMFIRISMVGAAIFMFVLAALQLITAGWDADKRKEAKGKFLYGTLALVFFGIIQAWVQVVYGGDIETGRGIFAQMANMALFFAGPTAIFFLIIGAYYYITSAGDEEKAKKGKNIVVYTFIAVLILLASYTFLKDLADFSL